MLPKSRPVGRNQLNHQRCSGRTVCDPCGIFCIGFVYLILAYSDYAYTKHVLWVFSNEPFQADSSDVYISTEKIIKYICGTIYQVITFLVFWTHFKSSFSDPGVVEYPNNQIDFSGIYIASTGNKYQSEESLDSEADALDESWTICNKCDAYRPPKAHHCRICQRCIRKMDHHCPWINNCVGEGNQKFFLQFLFYVGILCLLTILTILIENLSFKNASQSQIRAVHCIILLIESLLFGIFVIAVFTDQVQLLLTNESTIDRYKNYRKRKRLPVKRRLAFRQLFGSDPIIFWFLPIQPRSRKHDCNNQFII